MTEYKNAYGLGCPNCGSQKHIEIKATVWVRLLNDGTEENPESDREWSDDSRAHCPECGWSGTVGELNEDEESEDE